MVSASGDVAIAHGREMLDYKGITWLSVFIVNTWAS